MAVCACVVASQEIVSTALEHHVRMVREYSGAPGVKPERLAEALKVCGAERRSAHGSQPLQARLHAGMAPPGRLAAVLARVPRCSLHTCMRVDPC